MHTLITISREYCSGGRLIGNAVAKELGVPFYDRELISLAAQKSGLSPEFIENHELKGNTSFLYGLSTGGRSGFYSFYETPIGDKAFFAQAAVIRELAARGSCVIVGRCAGYILRNDPNRLNVFLYAPLSNRVKTAQELYDMEGEDLSEQILRIDKGRKNYHKNYTGENWSDLRCYDLAINTAASGIQGAVQAILALARA